MNDEYRISNDEVDGKSNIESESSNIEPLLSSEALAKDDNILLPAFRTRLDI